MLKRFFTFIFEFVIIFTIFCNSGKADNFNKPSNPETEKLTISEDVISLDPSITYQTMTGWEATAYTCDWPGHSLAFPKYMNDLANQAVNDLGINRVRLELYPGSENPVDYGAKFLNGEISEKEYIHNPGYAYQIVNDNNDSETINSSGFHFSFLDHIIDNIVIPLKHNLETKGERLYINLSLYEGGNSIFKRSDYAGEYAEFVLATYQHMQDKYGWTPDAWEIALGQKLATEYDEMAERVGKAIIAAANRLKSEGFIPHFIAPSNTDIKKAITFFDKMVLVPEALHYIEEFSYNRYGGASDDELTAIADRAIKYNIDSSMRKYCRGSGYQDLHKDLKIGRNSSWSQFVLASKTDGGGSYYQINDTDPENPIINISERAKFLRQYFKFIRSGAIRIEAITTNNNFDPLAFINVNGSYIVMVKADKGGEFSVEGLPPGTYGIKYTTGDGKNKPSEYDVDFPDATIGSGQSLTTNVPTMGILTVYQK